jgi:hypothetical protein
MGPACSHNLVDDLGHLALGAEHRPHPGQGTEGQMPVAVGLARSATR